MYGGPWVRWEDEMSTKERAKFAKNLDNAKNTARIRLFKKASKKYQELAKAAESIEPSMVSGLNFLSALYAVNDDIANKKDPVQTGSLYKLSTLEGTTTKEELPMVLPGGVFGELDTERVLLEIKALLRMDEGMTSGNEDAFKEAISIFLELGSSQLLYSRYVRPLQNRMAANRAALECEARSQIIKGKALADGYPNAAIPHFMIATRALRAARRYDDERKYRETLIGLRMVRRCWVCGRQVQGQNHFTTFRSSITEYFKSLLVQNKEDLRVYDGESIVVCTPCASAITKEADRIARVYSDRLVIQIEALKTEISQIKGQLAR